MRADSLSPGIWNAIAKLVNSQSASAEISFHNVTKRDSDKKVIWVEEFGTTAIPLIHFGFSFAYYDTQADGTTKKRYDTTPDESDPAFHVKVAVPRIGQTAVILNPAGTRRFPVCVGIVQSVSGSYWQGE